MFVCLQFSQAQGNLILLVRAGKKLPSGPSDHYIFQISGPIEFLGVSDQRTIMDSSQSPKNYSQKASKNWVLLASGSTSFRRLSITCIHASSDLLSPASNWFGNWCACALLADTLTYLTLSVVLVCARAPTQEKICLKILWTQHTHTHTYMYIIVKILN